MVAVKVAALLAEFRAAGVAPNLAAGVSVRGRAGWVTKVDGDHDLVFDLASVTKSMTAVAAAAAGIARTETVGAALPALADTYAAQVTLEQLLSHRAGLQAHQNLFLPLVGGQRFEREVALREAANARRTDQAGPAFDALYSDMGYALAGEMVRVHTGTRDMGETIKQHVASQLDAGQLGVGGDFRPSACAPTEDVPWRGGLIRGVVHDENAFALSGAGCSGHAGMFGDVASVLAFGRMVLDGLMQRGQLQNVDLDWLVAPRSGGTHRAGFDGKSAQGSSAGQVLGPRTFGHLGFTGTSLWIDPDAALVTVFLTNRVCPTRENLKIREARPRMHDALAEWGLSLVR